MTKAIKISTALQIIIILMIIFILAMIYSLNRINTTEKAAKQLESISKEAAAEYENKIAFLQEAARDQRSLLPKPNIIFILIDTLRADHLSAYGYDRETSPVIDRLAEEGCLFYDASSQASWTKPSVASMFTSRYPGQFGMGMPTDKEPTEMEQGGIRTIKLDEGELLISEILKENAGYQTACISANSWIAYNHGYRQGFDFFLHLFWKNQHQLLFPKSDKSVTSSDHEWKSVPTCTEVTDSALMWLNNSLPYDKLNEGPEFEDVGEQRDRDKPFFLYLHYVDPHEPYTPPDEDLLRFRPDWDGSEKGTREYLDKIDAMTPKPPEEIRDYINDLYDAGIYYNDREVGRLLSEMRKTGDLDNAVVIIVADHGEGLWNHGERGHGKEVYEEQIHVPLIFWAPNYIQKSTTVGRLVQCLDISPTLLDIVGIKQPDAFVGQSLLPLMYGYTPKEAAVAFVEEYQEATYLKSIRIQDNGKLIRDMTSENNGLFDKEELYDLNKDPKELSNLINNPDAAESKSSLQDLMTFYTNEKYKAQMGSFAQWDEATKETMKTLGYVK